MVEKRLAELKIAILGTGNMGRALLKGLLASDVPANQIYVTTRRPETRAGLAEEFGVCAVETNEAAAAQADVVLLAVKPQKMLEVAVEIGACCNDKLLVSVAAGITLAQLQSALGPTAQVIRAMPNTPCLIEEGATALAASTQVSEEDLQLTEALFAALGQVLRVDEEHMDAVTGLSGSGPAYVFLMIEAFADAGVKVGLSREIAQKLAVQTLRGAATMLQRTGQHPGQLKDMVTSPGGTAIAGLHKLEEGGLRTTIMQAVDAATARARALSGSDAA